MRRKRDSGYALLLVLAMGASVAIMLYMELPRLVFESQRVLEQDLIRRGEEYQRSIQLFVRDQRRYPTSIDELETTNNRRYLRRRYVDPMTGEDEWREIHIDSAGFFLDSLLHEPPSEEEETGTSQNTFITEGAAFGSIAPLGAEGEGAGVGANVQGASDRPVVTADQFYGTPGSSTSPQGFDLAAQVGMGQAPQPGQYPGGQYVGGQYVPGVQPGQQTIPDPIAGSAVGLPFGARPPDSESEAAQQQAGTQYPYPTIGIPGLPSSSEQLTPDQQQQLRQQLQQQLQQGFAQQQPGTGGPQFTRAQQPPTQQTTFPSSTPTPGQANNAAVDMIRNILTTPRPGGLSGVQSQSGGQGLQGGLAGVASTVEVEGIMVYNDRTKYNEWEFLYDYSADQTAAATSGTGRGAESSAQPTGQTGFGGGGGLGGNNRGGGANRGGGQGRGANGGQGRGGGGGQGRGGGTNRGGGGFGQGGQTGQFPPFGAPPSPIGGGGGGGRGR